MCVCACVCVCVCVYFGHSCACLCAGWLTKTWMKNTLSLSFFCVSRWAGNKAWQKMRRGWWLVRWMGTGMAILSLLTHSWGQDTEGKSSQPWGDTPQASPPSVNCGGNAKRELVMLKRQCFFALSEDQHVGKAFLQQCNTLNDVPNGNVNCLNSFTNPR